MSEAQLSGDQRAIQRFLGVIEPFKDDLGGARMAAAQRFYIRHKSGGSSQSMLARSVSGNRQALVKVIRNGGVKTMAQLGTQIDYVTREGTLEAKDNPLGEYYEAALSGEALNEKLSQWQQDFKGTPKLGHTTHVMVSFPAGTDRHAAEEAALEFGTRAFSADRGGDCYDWVAVQHNDTHYPHMHFIVKNRGMYEGKWFTIKRGSAHDVNTLRALQVEAAAEFGIELTATRRLERGITAPAVMTDEYRQAQLEGRVPHIVPRTAIEQHILNEIVIDHAETLEMLAETYDQMAGETVAELLRDSAALLKNGKEINVSRDINIIEHHAIGRVEEMKLAIAGNIAKGEDQLNLDSNPVVRTAREVNIASLKARSARFFPERPDYQSHAQGVDGTYARNDFKHRAVGEAYPDAKEVVDHGYAQAEARIAEHLEQNGVDPDGFLARYEMNRSIPAVLAEKWTARDLRDIRQTFPDMPQEASLAKLETLHAFTRAQLREASREIGSILAGRGIFVVHDQTEERLDAIEQAQARMAGRPDPDRDR